MGLHFSSMRQTQKESSYDFICLSGPCIADEESLFDTFYIAERLQTRKTGEAESQQRRLIICLPRQEHSLQVDQSTLDRLAHCVLISLKLQELELRCYEFVPFSIYQAVASSRSIRNLHLNILPYDLEKNNKDENSIVVAAFLNPTLESLSLRGDLNELFSCWEKVKSLSLCSYKNLKDLKMIHDPPLLHLDTRLNVARELPPWVKSSVDTDVIDCLTRVVLSIPYLKRFTMFSKGWQIHYSNDQLASFLQMPLLETLDLNCMQLTGNSSTDHRSVYKALISNKALINLSLNSFTKFVQNAEIVQDLESQIEAALRDSNTTLKCLHSSNVICTTDTIKYRLQLNTSGRDVIRNGVNYKLTPRIFARVSNNASLLYGLLLESLGSNLL